MGRNAHVIPSNHFLRRICVICRCCSTASRSSVASYFSAGDCKILKDFLRRLPAAHTMKMRLNRVHILDFLGRERDFYRHRPIRDIPLFLLGPGRRSVAMRAVSEAAIGLSSFGGRTTLDSPIRGWLRNASCQSDFCQAAQISSAASSSVASSEKRTTYGHSVRPGSRSTARQYLIHRCMRWAENSSAPMTSLMPIRSLGYPSCSKELRDQVDRHGRAIPRSGANVIDRLDRGGCSFPRQAATSSHPPAYLLRPLHSVNRRSGTGATLPSAMRTSSITPLCAEAGPTRQCRLSRWPGHCELLPFECIEDTLKNSRSEGKWIRMSSSGSSFIFYILCGSRGMERAATREPIPESILLHRQERGQGIGRGRSIDDIAPQCSSILVRDASGPASGARQEGNSREITVHSRSHRYKYIPHRF